MKKKNITTLIIIAVILIFAFYILNKPQAETPEELAKCIGDNSELYVQLGCVHCETQKDMFGENYKYIDTTDCFYERSKCAEKDITSTPTWIIKGQKIVGVQEIEELQQLTGC